MREASLAERIPLWRTLRENDVTALVTPALDYVGALRVSGVDPRFWTEAQRSQLGEGLRDFLGSLEEEVSLLFSSGSTATWRRTLQFAEHFVFLTDLLVRPDLPSVH